MFMKSAWNKMQHWFGQGDRLVWVQYSGLVLIILLPLLLPGYVFTLDMVFAPQLAWPQEVTNTYPLDVLLWLLGLIFPGDVVQKITLFAIFIVGGVGAHLFVKQLAPAKASFAWQVAAYFAGLFFIINPFIYARFMAGQWLVLLGCALLPFLVRALFRLLASPAWRSALMVALWMWAVMVVSVHLLGAVIVFAGLFVIGAVVKYWRQRIQSVRFAGYLFAAIGVALLLSACWIVPALFGQNAVGEIALGAGQAEFSAFATRGGPLGTVGEVLRLQGFWAESRQLFALPQESIAVWGILVLLLWVLVIVGAVRAWKTNRPVAIVMIGSIVAGVILAASPFVQWLAQTFPFAGGWREPHKFTILVVIGFAVLGAFGVAAIIANRKRAKLWAVICLLLPLLVTPTMLWAGAGQLQPRDYPREWYTLNDRLKQTVGAHQQVLFLPWHMYAPYSFSGGRIVANPAAKFFDVPVVISDDPEFEGVAPNRANETTKQISRLLNNPENVAATLAGLNIQYVILAKEQSWEDYGFLGELSRIYEDEKLILYEVK
jgi:hypothetical protein